MEEDMLEQIQQMITTATETLRQEIVGSLDHKVGNLDQKVERLDQKMDGLATSLRAEMVGMKTELREEMVGIKTDLREEMAGMKTELRQEMGSMESRLSERIEETKRHSGILTEDLHHKLDLVIEGQQFLRQQIVDVRSDMDAQTRETRTMIGSVYNQLNDRLDRHEQSHHT